MKKFYQIFRKVETYLVAVGFFAIISITFFNAVFRFFKHPIIATDDICSLLFAWVSFMGADVAMASDRLVGMDLITMKFSLKVQKVLFIAVRLIMITILCLLVVHGFPLAKMNWARAFNTLSISYGWVTLSLPVCSILMIITSMIKIVAVLRNFNNDAYTFKPNVDEVQEVTA